MDIPFKKTFSENSESLLRRSGYARQDDFKTMQISYFRSLGGQHFPKFHVYVKSESPLALSLHLDQKAHAYEGQSAHGGEYDGETVKQEAIRLWNSIHTQGTERTVNQDTEDEPEEKKSFFGRMFGG